MSSVRLRIDKDLDGGVIDTGAVVTVRRLDTPTDPRKSVQKTLADVGARAGRSPPIALEPGRYEFTAILPSGDTVSRVEEINAADADREIVLEATASEHEWMSWQHALGNVAGEGALDLARRQNRRLTPNWGIQARSFTSATAIAPAPDPLSRAVDAHLAKAVDGQRRAFATPAAVEMRAEVDPPYLSFEMPPVMGQAYDSPQFVRRYLLIADNQGRETLCVAPAPWRSAAGDEVMIDVLVGPDQPLDASEDTTDQRQPWCVSVIARDPNVASVLSYFTAGETEAAGLLADSAMELLAGKMTNPMAAAAGAYVLVDRWLREQQRAQRWLSWIDNLHSVFPWLPDAAILRGTVRLAGIGGTPDLAAARASLLEADRRGIPLFTEGLRRLESGLSRLAAQSRRDGSSDPELHAALQRARRLAWNADARFPYTTLRLWVDA